MSYTEIRNEAETKRNQLFKDCGLFFAFSNKQFEENKTPLHENEKYVSIGHGGYLPKSKVETFLNGMEEISKWEKLQIKKQKQAKYEHIVFELSNHECFYTNDISEACAVLPYPNKDILKVFLKEKRTMKN